MTMSPTRRVRCAIYTRKSSEEGLEQGFNSLDAQYEACAAYVLSQAQEGWALVPARYDDGGLSGGTLERPALKRLLADIAAGLIDTVVVYKVDRLSRSLFDFAKLVEAFEAKGTSFISITQSFNTTTSMGRLTLNMLLSFAQFEREVTAERIRDKIAASKAKGMWMGGIPPLGYKPNGRSLAIVDEHASFVRTIFERYLAVGTVCSLAEQLDRDGLHAPQRTTATGRSIGARALSRGQLYLMLKCRTYLGEVAHKGQVYAGLHAPIIERELWDRVQAQLVAHTQGAARHKPIASTSPLAGKLVDGDGRPLIATHASKAGVDGSRRRYRYYVSHALQHGGEPANGGLRVPARQIERAVAERLALLCDDPLALVATLQLSVHPDQLGGLYLRCQEQAARLRQQVAIACELTKQVRIAAAAIELTCDVQAIARAVGLTVDQQAPATVTISTEALLRRSGRAMRLVQAGQQPAGEPDPALVRLLLLARRWWQELRRGEIDVTQLAAREQRSPSYVTRIVRLAFLSPEVTRAILAGRQRVGADVATLTLREPVPVLWSEQGRMLLVD